MRYAALVLARVWLLVAVVRGWRHPTHGDQSRVHGGLDGARRRPLDLLVPPTMMKLYSEQETRGARLQSSVVRSFHDQGQHHCRRHRCHTTDVYLFMMLEIL